MANPFEGYRKRRGSTYKPGASGRSSGSRGDSALMGYILGQQQREKAGMDIQNIEQQVGGFKPGAKANITSRGAEVTQPLVQDFTLDESRAIGQGDAFQAHAQFLEDAMNKLPPETFKSKFKKATMHFPGADRGQVFGIPTTYGDKESQLIKFALQDMSDRILRLRSGAQINPQEANRLMALLPTWEDLSDPNDKQFEVVRTKLNQFNSDVNNIKNILQQGGNYKPEFWENLDNQDPNVLQHPAYSNYLKNKQGSQSDISSLQEKLRSRYLRGK